MNLHFEGLILAVTTFATIGIGHVLVRRLYPVFGTRAGPVFWAMGLVAYAGSLYLDSRLLSSVMGLVAITFVWDGIEFFRQKKRVEGEEV